MEGDELIAWAGYSVVCFDARGEFPEGTVAARISGPALPARGLPFCVPEDGKDIWARRWLLALAKARKVGAMAATSRQNNKQPPPALQGY
jgi:hypothetical protein